MSEQKGLTMLEFFGVLDKVLGTKYLDTLAKEHPRLRKRIERVRRQLNERGDEGDAPPSA